jgi:hypothetical protein
MLEPEEKLPPQLLSPSSLTHGDVAHLVERVLSITYVPARGTGFDSQLLHDLSSSRGQPLLLQYRLVMFQ